MKVGKKKYCVLDIRDTLYLALSGQLSIPEGWIDRILDKKVYLFTTYIMEQSWLDFFMDKDDNKIAIWRPHPNLLADANMRKRIEEIGEKYNVIIDDKPSYYLAFQISDALITTVHGSVMINYLCTGKPICLYNDNYMVESSWAMDYRNELWYQCAYEASAQRDVLEFIRKNEVGERLESDKQELYCKYITSNFDGKVCSRIYDYFESLRINCMGN